MSHWTELKLKIPDEEILRNVLKEMGHTIIEDKNLFGYAKRKESVDFQIRLDNSYNIGFRKVNGNINIITDWYGVRGVNRDSFHRDINQKYAQRVVYRVAKKKGYRIVKNINKTDNTIQITLRKW